MQCHSRSLRRKNRENTADLPRPILCWEWRGEIGREGVHAFPFSKRVFHLNKHPQGTQLACMHKETETVYVSITQTKHAKVPQNRLCLWLFGCAAEACNITFVYCTFGRDFPVDPWNRPDCVLAGPIKRTEIAAIAIHGQLTCSIAVRGVGWLSVNKKLFNPRVKFISTSIS